ncbi:MAG TPA: alpha/beta hydrolase [Candidatus Limnocylindria bacterium]|nr:alpha/beta hydrolase [Candidatus Limnocylindria bacterium]
MPPRLVAIGLLVLMAGCAPSLTLTDGTSARTWGDGAYGVVVVPDADRGAASWEPIGSAWAEEGMTVLAVEEPIADAVLGGIRHLHEAGVERVAVLGAGAGAEPAMAVGREQPDLVDQLIVVSARGSAEGLGVFPKLFVASEGEPAAADATRMAAESPGDWNALYLASGDASGQAILEGDAAAATLEAILLRLEERR